MKLAGLQKLTLLDFPGKVACTVFVAGCNFRCPFCHNSSLVTNTSSAALSEEEFFSFLASRKNKLEGVTITGGEPLLADDIERFIAKIKSMGFVVKLDTNGSRPKLLGQLLSGNLVDYVAMDIKNSPLKYAATAGSAGLDFSAIENSVNLLISSNVDYEFRTTAVKQLHQSQDFAAIGELIQGAKLYVLQNFRQSDDVLDGNTFDGFTDDELKLFRAIVSPYVDTVIIRGI